MKNILMLSLLVLACSVASAEFSDITPLDPVKDLPHIRTKGSSGIIGQAWMTLLPTREYGNVAIITNYIVVVRSSNNKLVARVHSDAKGRFGIVLRPGTYTIRAVTWSGSDEPQYSEKQTGTIRRGSFSKAALHFP